ncbi:MAG TPA: DUF4097 family beta strand repeat-containing protein [Thermoanaerobaculia bacterium]|nr:DUF4097 family beta strand repeat-containing protein [Thermoanaerobaculia bacterium]HUM29633.1 DUF4097 family beta strand repeat-containing protein [Thermoanaerobaculia bacterium]HXK67284.1 DUF4097 family beta strand repeat-containing protein [Thermoanaerobaculia bacterium]
MKRMTIILSFLLTAALMQAQSETFNREIEARGLNTIQVDNVNGDIVIGVWDRDLIRVNAVISGTESDRKAIEIKVETKGDTLRIETDHSKRYLLGFIPWRTGGKVDYDIKAPARINAVIDSVNGNIEVTGLQGELSMDTVNGGVTGRDLGGPVTADSVNGSMDLFLTSPRPECKIETVNGSVMLRIPEDASCEYSLETINGRIDFAKKDIKVKGSGPKELTGTLGSGDGSISVEVINGSVTVDF